MSRVRRKNRYFLLSYAHSPPLPGQLEGDPDQWVRRLFSELTANVRRLARSRSARVGGFYDQDIPLGADWKTEFTAALETAQVFVPLYSPSYFARSRTGREWACYYERMSRAGSTDALARFQPVLWTPLRREQDRPGLAQALDLGDGFPAYADYGLQGLRRLQQYRADYAAVLDRLATRIIALAENDPVDHSPVPDLDQIASRFRPDLDSLPFGVTVAAPVKGNLPIGAPDAAYGKDGAQWRPFYTEQTRPLAFYAADQAERLDFAVTVSAVGAVPESPGGQPGVVLIDPWFVARDDGAERLRTLLGELPEWVLPMVVLDAPEDPRKALLVAEVRDIVITTGAVHTEPALAAVRGVTSLGNFVSLMPFMVAEAERRYLRHGPAPRPTRPRLGLRGDARTMQDLDFRRESDG